MSEYNVPRGEAAPEPPDLTIEMRPDWFSDVWDIYSPDVPNNDGPKVAVARLHLIRERIGAPVAGIPNSEFKAYQEGKITLEDIRGAEDSRVSIYSAHANSKNPGWEPMEGRPAEHGILFIITQYHGDDVLNPEEFLYFNAGEVRAFVAGVMAGEFDLDADGNLPPPPE